MNNRFQKSLVSLFSAFLASIPSALANGQSSVGYVNTSIVPGLNALARPFATAEFETIEKQFPNVVEGTKLFRLIDGVFTTNSFLSGAWDRPEEYLPLGEGFLLYHPLDRNGLVTFTGQVPAEPLTNTIPAGLSMRGSIIPQEGGVTSQLMMKLNDFDNLYLLKNGVWETFTYLSGERWHPGEPLVQIAQGFIVRAAKATNVARLLAPPPLPAFTPQPANRLERQRAYSPAALGAVNFANAASGLLARVKGGFNWVEGPEWRAQLLVLSDNTFRVIAEAPFGEYDLAGIFLGGRVDVPGTSPQETAVLRVRVLRAGELAVESPDLNITLGGGLYPPANLEPLQPMNVPLRLSIRVERGLAVVSWRTTLEGAEVQASSGINGGWSSTGSGSRIATPTSVTMWFNGDAPQQFFRLSIPPSQGD